MKNPLFFLSVLIATMIVFGCKKEDTDVNACFSYTVTETVAGEVQFINCSENATSYLWNFGDGKTSSEKEPKHIFEGSFPFSVSLIAINGTKQATVVKQVAANIMVYKPNIYIYPLNSINLSLKIEFPLGGNITESIPAYNDGWTVNIDPNGIIDSKFNYLFYESLQPNIFQYKKGWCVSKSDLKAFFEKNMGLYNFSDREITDFIEYWIPKLQESDYYMVYPQTNDIIDNIIKLKFSMQPNNVNRLFYVIVGLNN
jgi:PKD repeat protein